MKLTCPFCYENFYSSDILYRCENLNDSQCPKEDDPELAQYFSQPSMSAKHIIPNKKSGLGKLISKFVVSHKVKCDKCSKPTSKRVCPKCHNQMPTYFHQANSHVISIIGARNSGKTHYITVLINELMHRGYLLQIAAIPQDVGENRQEVTSIRYKNYYEKPLIKEHKELPQTQKTNDYYPLIYQIKSSNTAFNNKTKVLYLAFYDTAGENFRDADELRKLANYVSNSSGVIFLLDTLQIRKVKFMLENKGVSVPSYNDSYSDVLYKIIDLFEREGHISGNKAKSKIPVAITLSKFDEVLKNDILASNMSVSYENSGYLVNRKYSTEDIEKFGKTIQYNLVQQWEEEQFVHNVEGNFKNVQYFGISALGKSPANGKIDGELEPYRVMDPLLWILDNLKFYLPKAKK